jgi:hypothetical protein
VRHDQLLVHAWFTTPSRYGSRHLATTSHQNSSHQAPPLDSSPICKRLSSALIYLLAFCSVRRSVNLTNSRSTKTGMGPEVLQVSCLYIVIRILYFRLLTHKYLFLNQLEYVQTSQILLCQDSSYLAHFGKPKNKRTNNAYLSFRRNQLFSNTYLAGWISTTSSQSAELIHSCNPALSFFS